MPGRTDQQRILFSVVSRHNAVSPHPNILRGLIWPPCCQILLINGIFFGWFNSRKLNYSSRQQTGAKTKGGNSWQGRPGQTGLDTAVGRQLFVIWFIRNINVLQLCVFIHPSEGEEHQWKPVIFPTIRSDQFLSHSPIFLLSENQPFFFQIGQKPN